MAKPSVLFLTQACQANGPAVPRLVAELAASMVRDGWAVSVAAAQVDPQGDAGITYIPVPEASQPQSFMGGWKQAYRLRKALSKLPSYDLIITTSEPFALLPAARRLIAKKAQAHMHWVHTVYPDIWSLQGVAAPQLVQRIMRQRLHQLYAEVDKVVVVGRCMAKILVHEGLEPSRISVIPNWSPTGLQQGAAVHGAPVNRDEPPAEANTAAADPRQTETRQSYFDHTPKFRILHCGELSRINPISTFLQVAQKLEQGHPDIELVFVGAGNGHELLAQERARLGLNNIRLLPPQPRDRMYDLLLSGDLHMQGLRSEALGLTVPVEVTAAFAVGRPSLFVGPEESDPAKLIKTYQAGEIISPHDPDRLHDTILRYRYDSQVWFGAHRGALKAAEVFDPQESLQAWCNRARSMISAPLPTVKEKPKAPAKKARAAA